MATAVLLRSVARKISRAAAPTQHHPCAAAPTQHHRFRSGPANTNQIQQGTADVLVSAGMTSATGLRSVAHRLTTKMAHAPPPPFPCHRLLHCRGIHSRTSTDPIPSPPQKVLDTAAIDKALGKTTAGMAYIALVSAAIYMHFWIKPKVDELTAKYEALRKKTSQDEDEALTAKYEALRKKTAPASAGPGNKTQNGRIMIHSQENRVKELEATIMNLEAEIAKLKDSARSQRKV